jgi:hypothetical protein
LVAALDVAIVVTLPFIALVAMGYPSILPRRM